MIEEECVSKEKEVSSKEGGPLDEQGVSSPASIQIRSVKEGGKPNPKRLQVVKSSPICQIMHQQFLSEYSNKQSLNGTCFSFYLNLQLVD